MSAALDIAAIAAPAATALAGAYVGVELRGRAAAKDELRRLTDDAADSLERANQKRGRAHGLFVLDGANTSTEGYEALSSFRDELGLASQLRDRLLVRTKTGSPVFVHYLNALLALGRISDALGVAALWPSGEAGRCDTADLHDRLTKGEEDFAHERAAFLKAVQALNLTKRH